MPPLKVAHLTSVHKHTDVRIYQKECITLARNGYDVYLVAPDAKEEDSAVKMAAVERGSSRLTRALVTGYRVFRAAMRLKPDICHIHDPELLIWAPLMRLMGKQVIYDMHENTPKSILTKPWIPSTLRKPISTIFAAIERILAHKTQVIFAETDYANHYPWITDAETVLNMPLADHLLAIERTESPEPMAAYLGAVSRERGAINTVEALNILRRRGIELKWLCIGPVETRTKGDLDELIERYSLQNQVKRVGYTPPDEAWQMISGAWCGLAVLLPIPNYVTSYPTKIFEYMAMGIPVITSDFPLYKEVVEGAGCGICVDAAQPEVIADAINTLISDAKLRKEMGENGKKAVIERYNWNLQAEKLVKVYEKLSKKRKGQ